MIKALLLGVSGVGKSTLGEAVAPKLGWAFKDLDEQLRQTYHSESLATSMQTWGSDGFYQRSLNCLLTLDQDTVPWLIAVGAATQLSAGDSQILLRWPNVCLLSPLEQLWERSRIQRQDPRSFEAFLTVEYNLNRQKLYQGADIQLDISQLTLTQSVQKLLTELTHFS